MRRVADDVDLVVERLQRLQDVGDLEAGAGRGGLPFVHDHAVRKVDARQARPRRRGAGLRQRRRRRDHRFEQRQGNRDAHSVQERAT
jgi:hypothetical protein